MASIRISPTVIATLLVSLASVEARAQAYCALRDPVRTMQEFYPSSTGHRSIVRLVDTDARERVGERLPFNLHWNELGKHTLYVAFDGARPMGLVHVRSEKGRWGLVEIAWSLDLDGKVRGFRYQRCRSRARGDVENESFESQLRGKTVDALTSMLTDDGRAIDPTRVEVPAGAEKLAATTIRSGVKTLVVTEEVWSSDLTYLRLLRRGQSAFPRAARIEALDDVYSDSVNRRLSDAGLSAQDAIARESARAYRAVDDNGEPVGLLLRTECRIGPGGTLVWWSVDRDGALRTIEPSPAWPNEDVREAFAGLDRLTTKDTESCSTAGELLAAEVLTVAQVHLEAR